MSNNTALTRLQCEGNQLTKLDVSKNTVLFSLDCSGNQMTELDVSGCTSSLGALTCTVNKFSAAALNRLFETLPLKTSGNRGTVYIYGNDGTATCDQSIATDKFWTVNTTTNNFF